MLITAEHRLLKAKQRAGVVLYGNRAFIAIPNTGHY